MNTHHHTPQTHDLIVLSDLHLGEGRPDGRFFAPTEDFFRDQSFARFLEFTANRYIDKPSKLKLVLNGDIFDFLTITKVPSSVEAKQRGFIISPAEYKFGLNATEEKSIYKLEIIAKGHKIFFQALSRFVKKGFCVEIIRGNHDLELHFDGVQNKLLEILAAVEEGADLEQLKAKVKFHQLFYREEGRLHIEHGHQYDASNSIRYPLNPIFVKRHWWRKNKVEEETLDYPLGSIFVKFFYNRVRRLDPYSPRLLSPEQYVDFIRRYNMFDVWRVYKDHYPYFIAALSPSTNVGSFEPSELDEQTQADTMAKVAREAGMEDFFSKWNDLKISPESASKLAVVRMAMKLVVRRALWAGVFAFTALFLWLLVFGLIQNIPWTTANAFLTSIFAVLTVGGAFLAWTHFRRKIRMIRGSREDVSVTNAVKLAALSKVPIVLLGHTHKVDYQYIQNEKSNVVYANSGTWTSVNNPWNRIMRDARRLTFVWVQGNDVQLRRWNDDGLRYDDVPLFYLEEDPEIDIAEPASESDAPQSVWEHSWLPSAAAELEEDEDEKKYGEDDV